MMAGNLMKRLSSMEIEFAMDCNLKTAKKYSCVGQQQKLNSLMLQRLMKNFYTFFHLEVIRYP